MTVDETLATGQYTDRRGRAWDYFDTRVDYDRWQRRESRGDEDLILEPDEMRLLIERDLHRDECPGLHDCGDHPVPNVTTDGMDFDVWPGRWEVGTLHPEALTTLPEAMDAARALAVGE